MLCDKSLSARFLADQLDPREASEFEHHLAACPTCRWELETLAGEPSQWRATAELLGSSSERRCWQPLDIDATLAPQEHGASHADLSVLSPTDDPESLGRIGIYEVTAIVGRGGMGVVFKAFDRVLHRNVALKVLDPALAGVAAARNRFAREARAMAAISHEHVVPIYAVDEHRGLPFFAMEYVGGYTLETRLHRDGPLDLVALLRIAQQIASALAAAHRSGLVHRDIKPANILLDRGTERVRVADFGLARVANDASHTRSGFVAGTPQYMSPEQVRGDECGARSDLFSLGCVLYAMCVGHSPFRAESLYGAMQRIVHDEPRSLRQQRGDLPEWLEQLVFRLLEKQPARRLRTADEVAELLTLELQHLQDGPATVPPQRPWLKRATGRRWSRWMVAGGALGLCGAAIRLCGWGAPDGARPAARPTPPSAARDKIVSPTVVASDLSAVAWDAALGSEPIAFAIRQLSAQLAATAPSLVDGWSDDVRRLDRQLQSASRDLFQSDL